MPDDALFAAAAAGKLTAPADIEAQVQRMIADPKARGVVADFHAQWLRVGEISRRREGRDDLPGVHARDRAAHAAGDGAVPRLRRSGTAPGDLASILTAPFTFVNGPLAQYYGMTGVSGSAFVKTPLDRHAARRRAGAGRAAEPARQGQPDLAGSPRQVRARAAAVHAAAAAARESHDQAARAELDADHAPALHPALDRSGVHHLPPPDGSDRPRLRELRRRRRFRAPENGQPIDASGEVEDSDVAGPFHGVGELASKLAASDQVRACVANALVPLRLRARRDQRRRLQPERDPEPVRGRRVQDPRPARRAHADRRVPLPARSRRPREVADEAHARPFGSAGAPCCAARAASPSGCRCSRRCGPSACGAARRPPARRPSASSCSSRPTATSARTGCRPAPRRRSRCRASWRRSAENQQSVVVLDGIENKVGGYAATPGDDHMKGMGTMLTGIGLLPGNTQGGAGDPAGLAGGISVDQQIAAAIGASTKFRSLELGVQAGSAGTVWGYTAYSGANQPLPPDDNPASVWNRVFSAFGGDAALLAPAGGAQVGARRGHAELQQAQSARWARSTRPSSTSTSATSAISSSGWAPRRTMGAACMKPAMPATIDYKANANFPAVGKLQMDLLVMAMACDLDARRHDPVGAVGRRHPVHLGRPDDHARPPRHVSRRRHARPTRIEMLTKINVWYAQQFNYLLNALKNAKEADGSSMLDNTLVLWCNELVARQRALARPHAVRARGRRRRRAAHRALPQLRQERLAQQLARCRA